MRQYESPMTSKSQKVLSSLKTASSDTSSAKVSRWGIAPNDTSTHRTGAFYVCVVVICSRSFNEALRDPFLCMGIAQQGPVLVQGAVYELMDAQGQPLNLVLKSVKRGAMAWMSNVLPSMEREWAIGHRLVRHCTTAEGLSQDPLQ